MAIRTISGSDKAWRTNDAPALLGLAASPTFALMAVVAAADASRIALCSSAGLLPIDGMACMYLLMSVFHLSPWLGRLSAAGRRAPRQDHPEGE